MTHATLTTNDRPRNCFCAVCEASYVSTTHRCPTCKRGWDQLVTSYAFGSDAEDAAWVAGQQPAEVAAVGAVKTVQMQAVDECVTFELGISGAELAARIEYGAIRWGGVWYPVIAGVFSDDEHASRGAALNTAAFYASRAGIKPLIDAYIG